MERYLETLGLTPENLTTIITADTDEASVSASARALDFAARNRTTNITAAFDWTDPFGLDRPFWDNPFGRNAGGPIPGPNVNADVVPAMLTPGEWVIRKDMVQKYGSGFMAALNAGTIDRPRALNSGGPVVEVRVPQPAAPRSTGPARPPINVTVVADGADPVAVAAGLRRSLAREGF